jgi:hypothetical protein
MTMLTFSSSAFAFYAPSPVLMRRTGSSPPREFMRSLLVGIKGEKVPEISADEQVLVDLKNLPLGQESFKPIEDASLVVKPVDSPTSGFLGLSEELLGLLALGTVSRPRTLFGRDG